MDDITIMDTCAKRGQNYTKTQKTPISLIETHADENSYDSKKSVLGLNFCEESARFTDISNNEPTPRNRK